MIWFILTGSQEFFQLLRSNCGISCVNTVVVWARDVESLQNFLAFYGVQISLNVFADLGCGNY